MKAEQALRNTGRWLGKGLLILILLAGAFTMVLPFYWMVISSLKPTGEILQMPPTWLPSKATLDHYAKAFQKFPVFRVYANSLIVTVTVTVTTIFTSSLIGFVLGKYRFRGRELVFLAIIATMMIPFEVRMLPMYKLAHTLHLSDTYFGLMLPGLLSTFGIFLLRQSMHSIPDDLLDSSTIDGCTEFQKYLYVVLPLSKQVLGALAVYTFMWNWDEFIWPLLIINKNAMYTLPLALAGFMQEQGIQYGVFMAAATLSSIVVLIVFFIGQKQIIRGIALTGMK